jgi:hypothetical protein
MIDARNGALRLSFSRDETGPGAGPGLLRGRRGALVALVEKTLREVVGKMADERVGDARGEEAAAMGGPAAMGQVLEEPACAGTP